MNLRAGVSEATRECWDLPWLTPPPEGGSLQAVFSGRVSGAFRDFLRFYQRPPQQQGSFQGNEFPCFFRHLFRCLLLASGVSPGARW